MNMTGKRSSFERLVEMLVAIQQNPQRAWSRTCGYCGLNFAEAAQFRDKLIEQGFLVSNHKRLGLTQKGQAWLNAVTKLTEEVSSIVKN
jgi:predicted transcriptional regulator